MSDHSVARPQPRGGTAFWGQQTNIVLKELGYEQTMTGHKPLNSTNWVTHKQDET